MITETARMTNLFEQLGLPSSPEAIEEFLFANELPDGVNVEDAPFWTPAQAAMLKEMLEQDTNWSLIVDQLSEALRECACRDSQ